MRKIRTILVGAAAAALTMVAVPFAAQATETAPTPSSTEAFPPDGNLYAYIDINFGFPYCNWPLNSDHWGPCYKRASSLINWGYPGHLDDVQVFYGPNRTGARRGVHQGVKLADLRQWRFAGPGLEGDGKVLNDNIASHRWVNLP